MSINLAWKDVKWKLVYRRLSRQQRRVYKASLEGNTAKVQALQRRIISSLDARLIAVKCVTTDNNTRQRNIASMKGQKAILNDKKIKLASNLKLDGKASAIRRVCIQKNRKSKIRLLDISIIEDRAKQMLAKLALEPEWEAIFESNSYGCRPGRSYYDAIASLVISLRDKPRFVLDTDIHNCFGRINHEKLLKKLGTFGQMESQISAWLKTDIILDYRNKPDEIFQSMEGKSQEGIIYPLLVNIALHGLETYIKERFPLTGLSHEIPMKKRKASIGFSRYVDHFVITALKESDIMQIRKHVNIWLNEEIGFTLSKAKIRIMNSTEGFEFLGFHLILRKILGQYKLKIHPSKSSKQRLISKTRDIIQKNRSASSYNLINLLTPRIIGWSNYFKFVECQIDLSKMDYLIFKQVRAWVFRRKSKGLSSRTKIKDKYFPNGRTYVFRGRKYTNNWILVGGILINGKKNENFLPKLLWFQFSKHDTIRGNASPYDSNYTYWTARMKKYSGYNRSISKLIKR